MARDLRDAHGVGRRLHGNRQARTAHHPHRIARAHDHPPGAGGERCPGRRAGCRRRADHLHLRCHQHRRHTAGGGEYPQRIDRRPPARERRAGARRRRHAGRAVHRAAGCTHGDTTACERARAIRGRRGGHRRTHGNALALTGGAARHGGDIAGGCRRRHCALSRPHRKHGGGHAARPGAARGAERGRAGDGGCVGSRRTNFGHGRACGR